MVKPAYLQPNGCYGGGPINFSHRVGGGSDFGWNNRRTSPFESRRFGRAPKVQEPLANPVFRSRKAARAMDGNVIPMEQDEAGAWVPQQQVSSGIGVWQPSHLGTNQLAMKILVLMLLACLGGGCIFDPSGLEPLCVATGTCDAGLDDGGVPDSTLPVDGEIPADSTVPADADVPLGEPPVLTKPTPAFTADPRPNNLVHVKWNAPQTTPNGEVITGFELFWSDGVTSDGTTIENPSIMDMGIRVLMPNANYTILVSAEYDYGASYSEWSTPVNYQTDDSCVSLYKFDENGGDIVVDSVGSNDGILVDFDPTNNYAAARVPGISETGLLFDGAGTYVDTGNAFDFDSTDAFTFEAWVRGSTSSVGGNNTVFGRLDYTDVNLIRGYWFAIAPNGILSFDLISNHSNFDRMTINTTTQLNVQPASYHISAIYDGSLSAVGAKIFVDGVEQPVSVLHDELSGTIRNNVPCLIGASIVEGGPIQDVDWVMDGIIDDLAIYDRVLTPDEILNNTCAREALNREENNDTTPLPVICN